MRLNKIVVLIILMFMVSTILSGCSKPSDGIDKDLWQDSVKVVKIIKDAFEKDNNLLVKDEEFVDRYFEVYKGRLYDNKDEKYLVDDINDLYNKYKSYIVGKTIYSNQESIDRRKQNFEKILRDFESHYKNLIK